MLQRKIILYTSENEFCLNYSKIFNIGYEVIVSRSEKNFISLIRNKEVDAAVICCCSASEENLDILFHLSGLLGPVPVIACSKTLNPEFIRRGTKAGVTRFVVCDIKSNDIKDIINSAIQDVSLKKYLQEYRRQSPDCSIYVNKLIDEIIRVFPHRIQIDSLAERLGIDRCWLYKICISTFNCSPTALIRHIWVHQALYMMKRTNLNNLDVAIKLDYTEESSMARDFRKELGYCPNKARKMLANHNPEELLH